MTTLSSILLITTVTFAQTSRPDLDETEREAARAMIRDAAVRFDGAGIQLARTRLEPFADLDSVEAATLYQLAFADFVSLVQADMGGGSSTPPEEVKQRLDRARASLERAIDLDEGQVEAVALLGLTEHILSNFEQDEDVKAALVAAALAHVDAARERAPDDAVVTTSRAFLSFMGGGAGMSEGTELLTIAVEQHRAADVDRLDHERFWWDMFTRTMAARMAMTSGDAPHGLELVEEVLAYAPSHEMALRMKPALEATAAAAGRKYETIPANAIPRLAWTTLSDDPAGDGSDPALADGAALAWACDDRTSTAWFRFELHDAPNAEAFGINVIVDSDADQTTGTHWWGTNNGFTWERLVTAWLTRGDDGRYSGMLGVGDLAGATDGDFTNLHRGGVKFAIVPEENAIVVGVPWSRLTEGDTINVVGAVGSNQAWNDDLADEGFATISCAGR